MKAARFPSVDITGAYADIEPTAEACAFGEMVNDLRRAIEKSAAQHGVTPLVMWSAAGRSERHKDGSVTVTPWSEMQELLALDKEE